MVSSTNSRVGYVGYFTTRHVADVIIVPWRISARLCLWAVLQSPS